jgi:LacI family transcriptional regulator
LDRTGTIGMLIPDITNPFFTNLVAHVEHDLQAEGMQLLLCSSDGRVELEAARLNLLQASQVDAVLVSPSDENLSLPELLQAQSSVPVVQIDQRVRGLNADWVGMDESLAAQLLVSHVTSHGAHTAAYIGGAPVDSSARSRLDAIQRNCGQFGLELAQDRLFLGPISEAWGREAGSKIGAAQLPDVVFCGADVIAYGLLQSFDELGVDVPGDVMVTGVDDVPYSSHSRIALTTIRQPFEAIAHTAVGAVMSKLGGQTDLTEAALKPTLIERRSTSVAEE